VKYAFMAEHKGQFRLSSMCRVLRVQRSGYYAWKANPKSKRALADDVLLASIRQSFDDSHGIYGSPRILRDLREDGMACGQKRVARLMRQAQLRSVRGYKRPRYRVGLPATAAPNRLQREFTVTLPNQVWVTDITYIRTHEGWLYLTAVIDLYSRMVVGWAMNSSMATELVLDALTMAVWRRRPTGPVMIHSDQGSQGEFNWSSQHLQLGGVYGATRRMDEAIDRERRDALSGGPCASARGRASVLGTDCNRNHQ